jgi:hypothetical protein
MKSQKLITTTPTRQGNIMEDNNPETTAELIDLATEAMAKKIPVQPEAESPCADKDTSCNRRWIEAFSDCA